MNAIKVIRMKQKLQTNHPNYLVTLPPDQDMKAVRNIKYLCLVKVYWDKLRKNRRVTQCRTCQRFGHGTQHCKMELKCMKCARPHLTNACTVADDEPKKCSNCNGEHWPSDYKCPVYLNLVEKIDARTTKRNVENTTNKQTPAYTMKSFSQLRKQTENHCFKDKEIVNTQLTPRDTMQENRASLNELRELQELTKELKKLSALCNIGKMLRLVKCLNEKLVNCKNDLDRIQIFSEIIINNGEK